ncbi:2-C-methyl-D-erythritol 2,4-cyclodiphosphate synthase [candidate division KSB1 bacterium]
MNIRVGFGSDIHQLKEGKDFFIGGVKIHHIKGAIGHSDADVLIHAICDACLGAVGLRDIGYQFPDTNDTYKGFDSKELLKEVINMISKKGWKVINIDSVIHLEKPKLADYIPEMRNILAVILRISSDNISIKAKTSEMIGFVGREEGVKAEAVVLLVSE